MVSGAHSWTNTSKHYNSDLFACKERVSEHHCQFALSKWHMLALISLSFLLIKCTHTFFKSKQRLIDFSPLCLSILVVTHAILSSLTTSQINKQQLSTLLNTLFLNLNLSNSMTSTRCIISLGSMRRSHLIALLNQLKNMIIIIYKLFF